jgi:hypothetical protein
MTHREFLGLVTSPGAGFSITPFFINPFNPITFPWLSEIAGSFETFRLRGMVVEFVSTYGDAVGSTNASLGSVILATQYNTAAPPFATQSQMENYEYATSCKPSVSMIHPVECDPSQLPLQHLYVFPASGTDPRWTNLGVTYLATVGQQAAATLGELWVSFDIEFYQPKLLSAIPSNGLSAKYFSNNVLASAWSPTNTLGTTISFPSSVTGDLRLLPQTTIGPSTNGFAFPPGLMGTYLVVVQWCVSQGTTITAPLFVSDLPNVVNGRAVTLFSQTSASGPAPINNANLIGTNYGGGAAGAASAGSVLIAFGVTCTPLNPNQSTYVGFAPLFTSNFMGYATGAVVTIDVLVTALSINS